MLFIIVIIIFVHVQGATFDWFYSAPALCDLGESIRADICFVKQQKPTLTVNL
jgi:hypothetical protein